MSDASRYPIGKYKPPTSISADDRHAWIQQIADLPIMLDRAVRELDETQLDTPYREGGWTVRQVVHHIPDSHINAYVRFRLTLTEDTPRIKPYKEDRWAELSDARSGPIALSMALTRVLHERWVYLLRAISEEEWSRAYEHPDGGTVPLSRALGLYAWHGRHHLAHITGLRERRGW
ncbi:MAG: bacillithiol transferase BstA [Rhodothermales bacterium]